MHFSLATVASALLWAAIDVQALPSHHDAAVGDTLNPVIPTWNFTELSADRRGPNIDVKDHKCNIFKRPDCPGKSLKDATAILRSSGDMCSAEPGECKQIACKKQCGIWLCNYKKERISKPCKELADHAQYIFNTCSHRPTLPRHPFASGTVTDKEEFVIQAGGTKGKEEYCK